MSKHDEIKTILESIDKLKYSIPTDGSTQALEQTRDLAVLQGILCDEVKKFLLTKGE